MSTSPEPKTYTLPPAAPPNNEGATPAAWMMFWGIAIGLLIAVVGFALEQNVVLIAGIVIIALGLAASYAMRRAGMGQPLQKTQREDWYGDPARSELR